MVFLHSERIDSSSIGLDSSRIPSQGKSLLFDCRYCLQGIFGSLFGVLLLAVSTQRYGLGRWTHYFHRWIPDSYAN